VTARRCSERHVGWYLSDFDIPGVDFDNNVNAIVHGLTYALVLTPVSVAYPRRVLTRCSATALTFVALLLALFTHRIGHIVASLVSFLAAFVAMLACVVHHLAC